MALALGGVAFWALAQLGREPLTIEVSPAVAVVPLPKPEDRLVLVRSDFSLLPGWADDSVAEAAPAVTRSCAGKIPRGSPREPARFGTPAAWLPFCAAWAALPPGDDGAARTLVERELVPWAVANRDTREGLLTGYYEPELAGSRKRTSRYRHPLYRDPRDRQVVDLGEFKRDLAGRKVTGMVRGGRFRPYWDRKEIERGALAGRSLELLWVDDAVAHFFLQIQGSGRVVLPDGSFVRVGYDGQNGHDYTAVGRILIERGELTKEAVSLQSIRAWLRAHPERAEELLHQNRSFVFFRLLGGSSPEGASGVELTPGRSLAVDDDFLPYGVPLFLDSTTPTIPELGRTEEPLRRLVVAQDTGGAIVGPVRGDLFFGPGREAEELAGRMKQPLRYWLLLPRSVAAAVPAP